MATAEGKPVRNEEVPAAFWDSMVANEANPDLMAIKALQEESTPEERAETLKVQGNEQFTRGVQMNKKFYLQQAIVKYTEGLKTEGLPAGAVKSILYSNRAQAQLRLANNAYALEDALQALDCDPSNVKAAFRGATAAVRLGEFKKAVNVCERGLRADPAAPELLTLAEELKIKAAAAQKAKDKEASRQVVLRAPARKLAITLLKQGWRIGAPQVSIGSRKPHVDDEGLIHWPVIFIYPEVMENDIVEDFKESHTLKDHLDVMFGPDAEPLKWDKDKTYSRERLQVFYLSNAASPLAVDKLTEALHSGWPTGHTEEEPQRYGEKASRPKEVEQSLTLRHILDLPDFVAPGLPVFFLLSKGSLFRDKFLESL